jgi:uncharacterized membrane protein
LRLQRAEWATALLITLFAVALHALRLIHAGPLWRDEAGAAQLAALPTLGEVFTSFPHEAFPPLFPVLVRTWMGLFGDADRTFRVFGLAVGLALLAVLWWTARRAAGTVPLLALALVAVNPSVLLYGDSLRGYGLGTAAIVVAFGAFARLAARPERGAIAGAAAAALLSLHLLFHNAALLLALGLAATGVGIVRRRPRLVAAVAGIGALAALSLLPYAGPILSMRSWNVLVKIPASSGEILGEMARTASAPVEALLWVWLLLLALALLSPGRGNQEGSAETGADVRLFSRLALPLVILAQWGLLEALGYTPRSWYFLPVLALAAVSLDVLLSASPLGRTARLGAAVLAVLALALPATGLARIRMTNMDLVADRIAVEAAPGDLVVLVPWYHGINYRRHGHGQAPWVTVPDLADHGFHRYDLVKARMAQPDPLEDVLQAVERTLRAGGRVWVAGEPAFPRPGEPVPVLPQAPAPGTGWQDVPYLQAWSLQLGAFLRDHATGGGRVPVPSAGPVSGLERLDLLVFQGWRD